MSTRRTSSRVKHTLEKEGSLQFANMLVGQNTPKRGMNPWVEFSLTFCKVPLYVCCFANKLKERSSFQHFFLRTACALVQHSWGSKLPIKFISDINKKKGIIDFINTRKIYNKKIDFGKVFKEYRETYNMYLRKSQKNNSGGINLNQETPTLRLLFYMA